MNIFCPSRACRDPVRDRAPEQRVDRALLAWIDRQIRVLNVARDQPGALQRPPDAFCDPLRQPPEPRRARRGPGRSADAPPRPGDRRRRARACASSTWRLSSIRSRDAASDDRSPSTRAPTLCSKGLTCAVTASSGGADLS